MPRHEVFLAERVPDKEKREGLGEHGSRFFSWDPGRVVGKDFGFSLGYRVPFWKAMTGREWVSYNEGGVLGESSSAEVRVRQTLLGEFVRKEKRQSEVVLDPRFGEPGFAWLVRASSCFGAVGRMHVGRVPVFSGVDSGGAGVFMMLAKGLGMAEAVRATFDLSARALASLCAIGKDAEERSKGEGLRGEAKFLADRILVDLAEIDSCPGWDLATWSGDPEAAPSGGWSKGLEGDGDGSGTLQVSAFSGKVFLFSGDVGPGSWRRVLDGAWRRVGYMRKRFKEGAWPPEGIVVGRSESDRFRFDGDGPHDVALKNLLVLERGSLLGTEAAVSLARLCMHVVWLSEMVRSGSSGAGKRLEAVVLQVCRFGSEKGVVLPQAGDLDALMASASACGLGTASKALWASSVFDDYVGAWAPLALRSVWGVLPGEPDGWRRCGRWAPEGAALWTLDKAVADALMEGRSEGPMTADLQDLPRLWKGFPGAKALRGLDAGSLLRLADEMEAAKKAEAAKAG